MPGIKIIIVFLGAWLILCAISCTATTPAPIEGTQGESAGAQIAALPDPDSSDYVVTVTMQSSSLPPIPASPTPPSTAVPTNTPWPTTTPSATPSPTPIGPCDSRLPDGDLLTIVTLIYGLNRDYAPADLVSLNDYLADDVTLGYPTEIRAIALGPLLEMITAMQATGLKPLILSGYRSYSAQAIAWDKWLREEPERAAILSAPPGHSEHQLGTTVDFGSPELPDIVGNGEIEFHTYFYQTSEGLWLSENAHLFGFTLSYPRGALETTGFYYEPWHYRYVGQEIATFLYESELYLTEFQFQNLTEPCIP